MGGMSRNMEHFRLVLRSSLSASWSLFFAAPVVTVVLAVVVWALAAFLQSRSFGPMMAALVSLGWTLVSTAIVFICLFLFHFIYLTPKRIIAETESKLRLSEDRIAALQQARQPRIKVSCGREIDGCVVPDHQGIWYRARLDLTGTNVSGLEASIVGLWEDGHKVDLYGEYMVVSMCMSEQKGQTTLIREGRPEFINLLFSPGDTQKPPVLSLKHYPGSVGDRVFLKLNHEYEMAVVLNCDHPHPTVPFRVKLKLKSNKDVEEFQLNLDRRPDEAAFTTYTG
jgi:hypothetical protein